MADESINYGINFNSPKNDDTSSIPLVRGVDKSDYDQDLIESDFINKNSNPQLQNTLEPGEMLIQPNSSLSQSQTLPVVVNRVGIMPKKLSSMRREGISGTNNFVSRKQKQYDDTDDEEDGKEDSGAIQQVDDKGNIFDLLPNRGFKKYSKIFQDLVKYKSVQTAYPIVSMIISYDSTRAITVTKKSEYESIIKMYSLVDFKLCFEEHIGGKPDQFIKVKEVEQNSDGTFFACVYFDDGLFKLRTFGKTNRTQAEIEENEVNINEIIGLDNYTMPNEELDDPFIACCFISDQLIFVALYHAATTTHYHFIWDLLTKSIEDVVPVQHKLDASMKNFPQKVFYSQENDELMCFYRQGEAFTMKPYNISEYRFEDIYDADLGQMMLIYGRVLIVRSASSILFFKQEYDAVEQKNYWVQYHELDIRGNIYFIKGNIRIQVVDEERIYFYLIDKQTYMPKLENVMYNYMKCTQMMFGRKVRNGITYKQNEKSFAVYQRMAMHNLKIKVHDQDLEGSKAIELECINALIVTEIDKVRIYDSLNYELKGEIKVKLLPQTSREKPQMIGIEKSKDENWLAVITGKNLIKGAQSQNQLFIYKRIPGKQLDDPGLFEEYKWIKLKEIPQFDKVVMEFFFQDENDPTQPPSSLLFAKKENIFKLDLETSKVTPIHIFRQVTCKYTAKHFETNDTQNIFVVASEKDGIWVNTMTKREIDLDVLFNISDVRSIIYDSDQDNFFMVANRFKGLIGFYLIRFDAQDPSNFVFHTTQVHNLDIDNVNMWISRGMEKNGDPYKELIISYKTIFINTYTVVTHNVCGSQDQYQSVNQHESFQLWESTIYGLLLQSKDFVSFNQDGMHVLSMGTTDRKEIKDFEGQQKIIHSLDSYDFLKADKENYIKFKCQYYSDRVISIETEFEKRIGTRNNSFIEHKYDQIYEIKIEEITLRELMILISFYLCKTTTEITKLIELQPSPGFFYKSFLELNGGNFLSMLSFDSGSMEILLNEKNKELFSNVRPIIYKTKIEKSKGDGFFLSSAIDNAIRANQVKAINLITEYIIKYQNNYVSSFLFNKNLPRIIEMGLDVTDLFNSQVYKSIFDFDEWPGSHPNQEKQIRAFNGSFFHVRHAYEQIFPEKEFQIDFTEKNQQKIYKIKYSINLLTQAAKYCELSQIGKVEFKNEEVSIINLIAESDDMSIFRAETVQDMISYKWDNYASKFHIFGITMNLWFTAMIILYVFELYIHDYKENKQLYLNLLIAANIYPVAYEIIQAYKTGFLNYIQENKSDMFYYSTTIVNIVSQELLDPHHILNRILMSVIVVFVIQKTFFYLRMFTVLTPIVVMLQNVLWDLRIFLTFYVILIFLSAHMFMIIGLGNSYDDESGGTELSEDHIDQDAGMRAVKDTEYSHIGLHLGTVIWTIRISIGDFASIDTSAALSGENNWLFWMIWLFVMGATCIVFLNFIVAEASASYAQVMEELEENTWKERAQLVAEAEDIDLRSKQLDKHPRYLITREIDN